MEPFLDFDSGKQSTYLISFDIPVSVRCRIVVNPNRQNTGTAPAVRSPVHSSPLTNSGAGAKLAFSSLSLCFLISETEMALAPSTQSGCEI